MVLSVSKTHPFYGLDSAELTVECLVKNVNPLAPNSSELLIAAVKEETNNPSQKPSNTHAKDLKDELTLCSNQVGLISKELNDDNLNTDVEFLKQISVRIRHWWGRTLRLKGMFHQDNDVDKIGNHWRRIRQLLEVQLEKVNVAESQEEVSTNIDDNPKEAKELIIRETVSTIPIAATPSYPLVEPSKEIRSFPTPSYVEIIPSSSADSNVKLDEKSHRIPQSQPPVTIARSFTNTKTAVIPTIVSLIHNPNRSQESHQLQSLIQLTKIPLRFNL